MLSLTVRTISDATLVVLMDVVAQCTCLTALLPSMEKLILKKTVPVEVEHSTFRIQQGIFMATPTFIGTGVRPEEEQCYSSYQLLSFVDLER